MEPPTDAGSAPQLAYRNGRLELDGHALDELARRQPTPFFAFSERRLVDNYRALCGGFGAGGVAATLRYSAKTNHEAGILAVLAREGADLLASHLAEVELALASGFPAERIAYQRPAPPPSEVAAVVDLGVERLHVLRPGDLALFSDIAERAGRTLSVSLRLRAAGRNSLSPLSRLNARFGLSKREARDVALAARDSSRLRVAALNLYIGTQQAGAGAFDRELARACALARALAAERIAGIEEINLGGGLPSPSLARLALGGLWSRWRDRPVATEIGPARLFEHARLLGEHFRTAAAASGLDPIPRLAAEPGRSIVGNAGVLVTRVTAVHGRWLFIDASRNFLGESSLLFRRALLPFADRDSERRRFFHLSGGTLNTTDVLDYGRRLPPLAPGEGLAICDAGAYSISRASRYAGVSPAVLLVGRDGEVRVIRRAEGVADLSGPMAPALPTSSAEAFRG